MKTIPINNLQTCLSLPKIIPRRHLSLTSAMVAAMSHPDSVATQYYHESEGPAPFYQLFRELTSAVVVKESSNVTGFATCEMIVTVEEITKSLEKTTIEESPAVFESNPVDIIDETPTFRGKPQNHRGKRTSKTGKNPNLRGNIAGGREDMANRRGNRPNSSSNVASSEGFLPNPKG